MIKLENVSKKFKDNLILSEVNVSFEEGNIYQIVGENGSGKSVLLKIIAGYSIPTNGSIYIDDEKLGNTFDFIPNAGISIDAPQFVPSLTGMENLLKLAKIRKKASPEIIINLAKKLEIDRDLGKKYSTYSLGMRQKMRLIQALMEFPKYLILDEPFDALDLKMKDVAQKTINDFITNYPDKIVIFTSHDTNFDNFKNLIKFEIVDKKISTI